MEKPSVYFPISFVLIVQLSSWIVATSQMSSLPWNEACPHDECLNRTNGYKFTDLTDCHAYYLCYNQMAIQQFCELGMKFIEEIQSCVFGKCPPCALSPIPTTLPPPTTPPSTTIPTIPTEGYDPTAPDCSKYPHGERLPHTLHCRFFWQCVEGIAVRLFCQIGMWWDRDNFVCNLRNYVNNCPSMQD